MIAEETPENISWQCWLRTLFAGSGAMMVFVFTGITESQSAVMLPQLKKEGSFIHVTPDEETWIASLGILMSPISAILVGPVIDGFGRKIGLQFFYLNMGLGFGVIACATEVYHIYIGRCICSFAVGLEVVAVVYLAEICTKKQRSVLFSIMSAVFSGGVTLTYIVGGYLPWNIASAIFSLSCFVYFIIQCCITESPAWLYQIGQKEASTRSLQKLGRSPSGIFQELEILKLSAKEETEKFELSTFLEPTVWKPLAILSIFHFIECASGVYDILYYTVDFVNSLGTTYNPLTVSILISVARFLTNMTIGIYFTASVSRKFATAFSGFWMMLALVGAGVYEWMYRDVRVGDRPAQWIPVSLMIVNIVASTTGMICLPWLMAGEMFPLRVRGAMTGIVFLMGSGFMFIFIKIYAFTVDFLQIWGLLFSFAAPCFMTIFFAIYMLPETQNKTLYEVEQGFLPKNKKQIGVEAPKHQIETVS